MPPTSGRDCLETPNQLRFKILRACVTGQKGTILGASRYQDSAIRPAQRLSRQSLEGVFSEVRGYGVLGNWLRGSAGGIMLGGERVNPLQAPSGGKEEMLGDDTYLRRRSSKFACR